MADRIQMRRDTKANWESYNPVLLEGEHGDVLDDPNLYKVGDGVHTWNQLPYRGYNGTVLQEVQDGVTNAVPSSEAVAAYVGRYYNNSEFLYVILDSKSRILLGIDRYANVFFGAGVPKQVIEYINDKVIELGLDKVEDVLDFLDDLMSDDTTLKQYLDKTYGDYREGVDWIRVELDKNGRILGGRKSDGTKVENIGLELCGNHIKYIYERYDYLELAIDSAGRIVFYRDKKGVLHEEAGIESPNVITDNLELSEKGLEKLNSELSRYENNGILSYHPKKKILPILKNLKFWNYQYGTPRTDYIPLSLMWFSDIHGSGENLARIKEFYDFYKDSIDDVFHTGDVMQYGWLNDWTFWDANNGGTILPVLGNHDIERGTTPASAKECYDRYIAPYLDAIQITQTTDKMYWYKDYPDAKSAACPGGIRFIALDQYHWKESASTTSQVDTYSDGTSVDKGEQRTWFQEVLADALTNGLAVIVGGHEPFGQVTHIRCSFDTLDPLPASDKTEILQDVQNFIDGGGEFITYVSGHHHQDWVGTLTNYPNQLQLLVGCAGYPCLWVADAMIKDTISMDRFNILNIEPVSKYIRLYRIGLEFDRHARHIGSLTYDYKNKVLINNF